MMNLYGQRPKVLYEEGHAGLVASIIRQGLAEEGAGFLDTYGGKFWCWALGIDPQVVAETMGGYTKRQLEWRLKGK